MPDAASSSRHAQDRLGASLEIFADVILNPSFPESDFQRLKRLTLAAIQQEKVNPGQMGFRVLPRLLYGAGHAYSNSLTGSGSATNRSDGVVKAY